MIQPDSLVAALDDAIEAKLASLGALEPYVLARLMPAIIDDMIVLWPSNAIGRVRVIRRDRGILFVTQGLSYPFNDLHQDRPAALGYELAIEVGLDEPTASGSNSTFGALSQEELASTWPVRLLWFLADGHVHDRWDLLPRLDHFGVLTTMSRPMRELQHLAGADGFLGLLVGRPFGRPGDEQLSASARLVVLQLLHRDEYDWIVGVPDSSRAVAIVGALDQAGWGTRSAAHRTSVIG